MSLRRLIAMAAVGSVALFSVAAASQPAAAHRSHHARHIHAVATFTPVTGANFISTISTPKTLQYGTVKLSATSHIDGHAYNLELTAGLEYVDGKGPFHGDITFIASDGDSLTFDYTGATTLNTDGSTTVTGKLKAFSGTGRFAHTTGTGRVLGTRPAGSVPGSPVTYVIDADVHDGARSMPAVTAKVKGQHAYSTAFNVDLMGVPSQRFITANPDGRSFGLIRLTGDTSVGSVPVEVVDIANVAYSHGSGPFNGFITLNGPSDSQLVMRFNGGTRADKTGGATIRGPLTVIAGTGIWSGTRGQGQLTGTRSGVVGSPLKAMISLNLSPAA
jgi:hypothetical protein